MRILAYKACVHCDEGVDRSARMGRVRRADGTRTPRAITCDLTTRGYHRVLLGTAAHFRFYEAREGGLGACRSHTGDTCQWASACGPSAAGYRVGNVYECWLWVRAVVPAGLAPLERRRVGSTVLFQL